MRNRLRNRRVKQKQFFDRGTRKLPEIKKGERVIIRHDSKWQPTVVLNKLEQRRSYNVQTPDSHMKNRRNLLKTKKTVCPSIQTDAFKHLPVVSPDIELNSDQENNMDHNASASC